MNLSDVQKKLTSSKVDPAAYSLTGGLPNEAYCIEHQGRIWSVYYSERGRKTSEKTFETEDEACREFLERIIGDLGLS